MVTRITLPNIRKLFIPDPGFVMFEADLKGADAQVVAWEANDEDLKTAFRSGVDIHAHNAEAMLGTAFTSLPMGSHARDAKRQLNKRGVHLTNYGGTSRGMAQALGLTTHEADRFQRRWFQLHPGILDWHERVRHQLSLNRTIRNAFGFRRVFFDRVDNSFTEALAWIPQSTVALTTYRGALQLERKYWPEQQVAGWSFNPRCPVGILLQTHDSINPQFALDNCPPVVEIKKTLEVVIAYPDPLIIPWDLKKTTRSWGEMEKC